MRERVETGQLRRGFAVRAPRSLASGLVLIVLSAVAIIATWNLRMGSAQSMGPAFFPRVIAIMIGISGIGMSVWAFLRDGPPIAEIKYRGMLFIIPAIILFGLTIRVFGLAVAGPLSLFLASFATPNVRVVPALALSIGVTVFCIVLFRVFLDLPMLILALPGTGFHY